MAGAVDAAPWVLLCQSHPRSLPPLGQEEGDSDGILPFPPVLWGYLSEHPHTLSPSDQLEQHQSEGTTAAPIALHPQTDSVMSSAESSPASRAASVWAFPRLFDSR